MAAIEEEWLQQLLGPETTTIAIPAVPALPTVPAVPAALAAAQATLAQATAAVSCKPRRITGHHAYVSPTILRKESAIPAGNGRATVVAVRVADVVSDDSDNSEQSAAVPPALVPLPTKRREKRKARAKPARAASGDGYASGGESPPTRPRRSSGAASVNSSRTAASSRRSSGDASGGETMITDIADLASLIDVEEFSELALLSPTASLGSDKTAAAPTAISVDAGVSLEPLDTSTSDGDAAPHESNRRKVRHNLTERRRVDRMNQLFNKLYTAIEEAAPATDAVDKATGQPVLGVLGADGKPINPSRWSKADVLEGALNIIIDLRRQLSEERLSATVESGYAHSASGSDLCTESDQLSDSSMLAMPLPPCLPTAPPAVGLVPALG